MCALKGQCFWKGTALFFLSKRVKPLREDAAAFCVVGILEFLVFGVYRFILGELLNLITKLYHISCIATYFFSVLFVGLKPYRQYTKKSAQLESNLMAILVQLHFNEKML